MQNKDKERIVQYTIEAELVNILTRFAELEVAVKHGQMPENVTDIYNNSLKVVNSIKTSDVAKTWDKCSNEEVRYILCLEDEDRVTRVWVKDDLAVDICSHLDRSYHTVAVMLEFPNIDEGFVVTKDVLLREMTKLEAVSTTLGIGNTISSQIEGTKTSCNQYFLKAKHVQDKNHFVYTQFTCWLKNKEFDVRHEEIKEEKNKEKTTTEKA